MKANILMIVMMSIKCRKNIGVVAEGQLTMVATLGRG
jgi:hypothetical protein